MQPIATKTSPPQEQGPAWDIARLFPNQGAWSEGEYLELNTNHLVEYRDGHVEVLPMPGLPHQRIVRFLWLAFHTFLTQFGAGEVLFAPLPVRLGAGLFREPDVMCILRPSLSRELRFAERIDLAVEVVSPSNPEHDLVTKRAEYAEAGIPEYWIVDPGDETILVLTLREGQYAEHGRFTAGQRASSVLLPGFEVDVAAVFAAGQR